ncbi:MAG TPA: GntR family transcriptional regulator [Candidatus Aphodovivens avistercoris]|nr:GntR family transcriptional regulator [Candidatus Aphodovivens avistercoris]
MILRIDQASPDPIYQQIRDQIVAAIARGELKAGDRLPGVRALASDLGVNLHTVNKAYAVLRDEGYLLMRGRAGACIADFQQTATPERLAASAARLTEQLYRLALEHSAQGGTEEQFVEEARREAARAFADPGIAGAARDMHVLGLDAAGNRLVPRDARDAAANPLQARGGAAPASVTGPEGA